MTPTWLPSSPIDLLTRMVRFDTVNHHISGLQAPESELAAALELWCREWKLETQMLPVRGKQANLLVMAGTDLPGDWLLLESHLDTVATEGMTISPLAPLIEDGRMYGRGACDTKSSGAAMLWALLQARDTGTLANPTALLFSVDEEVGKTGIQAFVRRQLADLGWRPALALVGEPTLLAPVTAHNGAMRWRIMCHGVPAHSSNPANGRSAISDMLRVVQCLEAEYIPSLEMEHPLTGRACCSINQIHGGRQANMIPDLCEIVIDRRLLPGEDPASILPAVQKHLDRLCEAVPGLKVEQEAPLFDPPMEPADEGWVMDFLRPVLKRQGLPVEPLGMPYGTDAANLTSAGIPSVVIGPGDIAQAHTVDEWVAVSQVEKAAAFFQDILMEPLPAKP